MRSLGIPSGRPMTTINQRDAEIGHFARTASCSCLSPFVAPSSTEEAQKRASDLATNPRAGETGVGRAAADGHARTWAPTFAARGDPPSGVAGGPLLSCLAATAASCGRQRPAADQGVAFLRELGTRGAAGPGPRIPGGRPSGDPPADGAARVPGIRGLSERGAFSRIRSARIWASESGLWILTIFTDTSWREQCSADSRRGGDRPANWRLPPHPARVLPTRSARGYRRPAWRFPAVLNVPP